MAKAKLDPKELFFEWMASSLPIKDFAESRGTNPVTLWRYAKKYRWDERRAQIEEKALRKATAKVENQLANKFERHIKANDELLGFVYQRLKEAQEPIKGSSGDILVDEEGKPRVKGLTISEIDKLASALEKITKNKSFMSGGPSERLESLNLNANLHQDVTELILERRRARESAEG